MILVLYREEQELALALYKEDIGLFKFKPPLHDIQILVNQHVKFYKLRILCKFKISSICIHGLFQSQQPSRSQPSR